MILLERRKSQEGARESNEDPRTYESKSTIKPEDIPKMLREMREESIDLLVSKPEYDIINSCKEIWDYGGIGIFVKDLAQLIIIKQSKIITDYLDGRLEDGKITQGDYDQLMKFLKSVKAMKEPALAKVLGGD